MKMTLSCILFLLFVQCAEAQFTYPLQVGNRWQYKEPPPPEEPYIYVDHVLGDTLMPNGLVYRRISRGLSGSQTDDFLRQADNRIYQFLTVTDSAREVVRFDFGKNLYDTVAAFDLFPMSPVVITLVDAGNVLAFGVVRPYRMFYWEERGGTFYRFDTVVDSIGVMSIQMEPGLQLYLAGAVINDVSYGTVVAVDPGSDMKVPPYNLSQNYPNPFNPTTTIQYALPHRSHVTLAVYNTLGQQFAELVNGEIDAGYHELRFNASNLASGVYYYRLQADSFVDTRKLLLIR